jgi:hypothetical protein
MIGLIKEAQKVGLEMAQETGHLPVINKELITAVGHLVAAHVGVRDITKWPVEL